MYKYWAYNYPQHCGRVHVAELRLPERPQPHRVAPQMPPQPQAEEPINDWTLAIDKLRKAMEARPDAH